MTITTHEQRSEACQSGRVEHDGTRTVAWIWTPQIGGYVAAARVEVHESDDPDPCFDALVFHDGEFPSDVPLELHACGALQWVRFAARLAKVNGVELKDVIDAVRQAHGEQRGRTA